jgi:hypothetical protein
MKFSLKNSKVVPVLLGLSQIIDDANPGIYKSDMANFDEYSWAVIAKDHMGECIGFAMTPSGDSYVFGNLEENVEFTESSFYPTNEELWICT